MPANARAPPRGLAAPMLVTMRTSFLQARRQHGLHALEHAWRVPGSGFLCASGSRARRCAPPGIRRRDSRARHARRAGLPGRSGRRRSRHRRRCGWTEVKPILLFARVGGPSPPIPSIHNPSPPRSRQLCALRSARSCIDSGRRDWLAQPSWHLPALRLVPRGAGCSTSCRWFRRLGLAGYRGPSIARGQAAPV